MLQAEIVWCASPSTWRVPRRQLKRIHCLERLRQAVRKRLEADAELAYSEALATSGNLKATEPDPSRLARK